MKLKCICCEALARMVYRCAADSPNIVDVSILRLGLHSDPADLRRILQQEIDVVDDDDYDATILAYGLCGRATAGLTAREKPVVIPRAHDCITLFLGNRQRYSEHQEQFPGTYWYTRDYIERGYRMGTKVVIGAGIDGGNGIESEYDEFVQKYGKDNADYLMEIMGAWQKHYQRAAYIDLDLGDGSSVIQQAKDEADRRGWIFEQLKGDMQLVKKLIDGVWDTDILILQPGEILEMSYDNRVVCARMRSTDE